jgi:pyruvate carboxylase subunit B
MGIQAQDKTRIMKYTVTAGERTFDIDAGPGLRVNVDGKDLPVEFVALEPGRYMLRVNNRSYEIVARTAPDPDGHRMLHVNGRPVTLRMDDATSLLIRSLEGDKASKVHSALVKAPMPGRIARVLVSEGELIEAGQGVCILEAMKMENEIKAAVTGIVKSVRVREGDAVEKNALLLEIA